MIIKHRCQKISRQNFSQQNSHKTLQHLFYYNLARFILVPKKCVSNQFSQNSYSKKIVKNKGIIQEKYSNYKHRGGLKINNTQNIKQQIVAVILKQQQQFYQVINIQDQTLIINMHINFTFSYVLGSIQLRQYQMHTYIYKCIFTQYYMYIHTRLQNSKNYRKYSTVVNDWLSSLTFDIKN
eukprot:TRINITY_DN5167_c1_g2_i1.p1 TRINITY_DN5167_c1_g2~~TRINITY_DN5167_c1_g2_i1.p1  ORF type:complete len:206 (-),score=-16.15 TRINITY_DN5167_c1_g2_i1:554-1096(-)